jgi:hypothetical protein
MPGMLNEAFGDYTYHVLGIVETVKGALAFVVSTGLGPTVPYPVIVL